MGCEKIAKCHVFKNDCFGHFIVLKKRSTNYVAHNWQVT